MYTTFHVGWLVKLWLVNRSLVNLGKDQIEIVFKSDMSKWGFKVHQSFRYGVPGQVVAKHVVTERKQEAELVLQIVTMFLRMINQKMESAMKVPVSNWSKNDEIFPFKLSQVHQNSQRGVHGQLVDGHLCKKHVTLGQEQEAGTVLHIVMTSLRMTNQKMKTVMRVTVSD